jgi:hypothetical protein
VQAAIAPDAAAAARAIAPLSMAPDALPASGRGGEPNRFDVDLRIGRAQPFAAWRPDLNGSTARRPRRAPRSAPWAR